MNSESLIQFSVLFLQSCESFCFLCVEQYVT